MNTQWEFYVACNFNFPGYHLSNRVAFCFILRTSRKKNLHFFKKKTYESQLEIGAFRFPLLFLNFRPIICRFCNRSKMFVPSGLTGLDKFFIFVATMAFIMPAYLLIHRSRIEVPKSGRFFKLVCTFFSPPTHNHP